MGLLAFINGIVLLSIGESKTYAYCCDTTSLLAHGGMSAVASDDGAGVATFHFLDPASFHSRYPLANLFTFLYPRRTAQ
jgi:hypothetical protein